MQKKLGIFLLGCALLLTASSARAQIKRAEELGKVFKSALSGKGKESPLSRKLKQRLVDFHIQRIEQQEAFRRASMDYLKLSPEVQEKQIQKFLHNEKQKISQDLQQLKRLEHAFSKDINPYELYPYGPEGLTYKNLGPYIWVKDRLEYYKLRKDRDAREMQIVDAMAGAGLEQQMRKSEVVPADKEAQFVISQLNPDTQYLLIGEEHFSTNVRDFIADLLWETSEAMDSETDTRRGIILFSEFVKEGTWLRPLDVHSPDAFTFLKNILTKIKDPVVRMSLGLGIPIIGLEPDFVNASSVEIWQNTEVEGFRLRNQRWLNTLRKYRQKYPNALFIIHAGRGHISYYEPFSLGKMLEGEERFVVEVGYETDRVEFMEDIMASGDLTDAKVHTNFVNTQREKNRVLRLEDPQKARLFGFDVRITVEK